MARKAGLRPRHAPSIRRHDPDRGTRRRRVRYCDEEPIPVRNVQRRSCAGCSCNAIAARVAGRTAFEDINVTVPATDVEALAMHVEEREYPAPSVLGPRTTTVPTSCRNRQFKRQINWANDIGCGDLQVRQQLHPSRDEDHRNTRGNGPGSLHDAGWIEPDVSSPAGKDSSRCGGQANRVLIGVKSNFWRSDREPG